MNDAEFERLLKTCRLQLSEQQKTSIKAEIKEIIDYFNMIDAIDTQDKRAAYHPVDITERTREDIVEDYENVIQMLENTKTYRFYVVGPKL